MTPQSSIFPVGAHSIVANYSGDPSFNLSSSSPVNFTITKATTTAAVIASPSTITSGGSVTLTATVNTLSNGVAPTGTVQFLNGTAPISGTVTYAPTDGSASGPARLTATLTTTLSASLIQDTGVYYAANPQKGPGWFFAASGLMAALLFLPGIPAKKLRRRKCLFVLLLLTFLAVGIAGCGGGGGGTPPPTGRTLSITAQYGGDSNYTNSTSPVAIVTVQ